MVDRQKNPARQLSWRRKLIYGLITASLVLLAGEGLLRLVGFDASTRVETMQFTFPVDDYNNSSPEPFLQSDPKLFWKPRPGVLGHNSHGFSGPEFSAQKPSGVFRIICLGDSCTHFGPEPYSEMLQQRLDIEAPGRFEVINCGVIGYTSFQGRTLMADQILGWSPDLVTVYFGWNDHWLARGYEDKDQREPSTAAVATRDTIDGMRIYQLMHLAVARGNSEANPKLRVEPKDYAENLMEIQRLCEEAGARTLFMTAPQALDLGIPRFLLTSGEVHDPEHLVDLHKLYNARVREIGEQTRTHVIDLESQIDAMNKEELFVADHIHLSQSGKAYVADQLVAALREMRVIGTEALPK